MKETHGVEISIAGGVGEMVRAYLLGVFFIFFIFILGALFYYYLGTKTTCSASYGKEKPL